MTSDELVEPVETKLKSIGITKVAPDQGLLATAYRRAYQVWLLNRALKAAANSIDQKAKSIDVPDDLVKEVREYLGDHPDEPWDGAIAVLVDSALGRAGA